jgi:DNA-binding NarL/FixJ family response regulator
MESAEKQITVVLADDHNVIRAGLRAMLEGEDDLRVIGEAADAVAALETRPDLVRFAIANGVIDAKRDGDNPA